MNLPLRFSSLVLIGLSSCSLFDRDDSHPAVSLVRVEEGPEAEARAALVNVIRLARQKDLPAFKKLILPADLPDFEAREKERPGFYQAMMATISAEKPREYRLELTGSLARFTAQPAQKIGDYSKKPVTKVLLVRDGDQWELGKN